MKKVEKRSETVKSVERALDILLAFTEDAPQLSLPEICNKLKLPKSTVYRLITTLQGRGFMEHNEFSGKYQPGSKLLKLSNVLIKNFNLRENALPIMMELRDACGETINLYAKKNLDRVCIEQVEGSHLVRRFAVIGDILPLYCGASGKVLLAYQTEVEIEKVIKETQLKPWTSKTITVSEDIKQELVKIRNQGYAYSNSEREEGVASVAAPIKNYTGMVTAAICISGPDSRFTKENVEQYTSLVIGAAEKISRNLGYMG